MFSSVNKTEDTLRPACALVYWVANKAQEEDEKEEELTKTTNNLLVFQFTPFDTIKLMQYQRLNVCIDFWIDFARKFF